MLKKNESVGVVELFVEIPPTGRDGDAYAKRSAINHRIQQRCANAKKTRLRDVLAVLRDPRLRDVTTLVFPGWTLPTGDGPIPREVLDAIGERTVVFETFDSKSAAKREGRIPSGRKTHVLLGRKPLIDAAPQVLATSADADLEGTVTTVVTALKQARRWKSGAARCGLVICGEVNVVFGEDQPRHPKLERALEGIELVVNPAHTRTTLPKMHGKREWFARGRALVTCANLHGPVQVWQQSKTTKEWYRAQESGSTTAQLFVGNKQRDRFSPENLPTEETGNRVVSLDGGHRVMVVNLGWLRGLLHAP